MLGVAAAAGTILTISLVLLAGAPGLTGRARKPSDAELAALPHPDTG